MTPTESNHPDGTANTQTPELSEAAQAMREVARQLVDSVRATVEGRRFEFTQLTPAETPRFDHEFYDNIAMDLTVKGIRFIGNYCDVDYKEKYSDGEGYYRIALSDDGLMAAVWLSVPAPWPDSGVVATRCVLLLTWLTDGRQIVTSKGSIELGLPYPPFVLHECVDEAIDIDGMLDIHRRRLTEIGGEGRELGGADEILAAWREVEQRTVEFRKEKGLGLFEPLLRTQLGDEYEQRGKPILEAILAHPQWWSGPTLDQQFPHVVVAKLFEPIGPVDRGERYEDPLQQMLDAHGLGKVTGGGSQLTERGEIAYADVELVLANVDGAIDSVKQVLEEAGAPVGSELQFKRDGKDVRVPVGIVEGLAVYLDAVGLPDDVYDNCDIDDLEYRLAQALAEEGGELRGWWDGSKETSMYMYGPSAEDMFKAIQPILAAEPICQNARVVIRFGNANLKPRTVRVRRQR